MKLDQKSGNAEALAQAVIYLEDQDSGFGIVEVNEAVLEQQAVRHIQTRLPTGHCCVIDLQSGPTDTPPLEFIRNAVADAPNAQAFLILNFHRLAGELREKREQLVRELNFNREAYARLNRLLLFFFPTWFVDLIIRHAKDFFDFVPVLFSLKSGDILWNKIFLENRIAFLEEILASGDLNEKEMVEKYKDLKDCYETLLTYYLTERLYETYKKALAKSNEEWEALRSGISDSKKSMKK